MMATDDFEVLDQPQLPSFMRDPFGMLGRRWRWMLVALTVGVVSSATFITLIKPRYVLAINTNDAAGLRSGSAVELNGVPIGVVSQNTMRDDSDFPVQILVLIDEGIRLAADIIPFATS